MQAITCNMCFVVIYNMALSYVGDLFMATNFTITVDI